MSSGKQWVEQIPVASFDRQSAVRVLFDLDELTVLTVELYITLAIGNVLVGGEAVL
jgi:hypothetical protein